MGAPFTANDERPTLVLRSCSHDAPVCVHFDGVLAAWEVERVRASASRAWSSIVDVLHFPPPLFDGDLGDDPRFDVYVLPIADGAPLHVGRDALDPTLDRDGASAFVVLDPSVVEEPTCRLDALLSRGIARASAFGIDVAETPVVVEGFARHVASVVAHCDRDEEPIFAAFQATPGRSLLDSPTGPQLLAQFVDRTSGQRFAPFVPFVLSMATQKNGVVVPVADDYEFGPAHFRNEPSVFDVLSATLGDQGRTLDDFLLDLAVSRALDHTDVPPKLDWDVAVSTLPRRLGLPKGIQTMGTSYDRIVLDRAPKGGALELELKWEQGARFRWAVFKLDAEGRDIGRVGVARLDRGREMTIEVRDLDGAASVLVVGFNSGDPARLWEPDDPPTSPHGYELGVYEGE